MYQRLWKVRARRVGLCQLLMGVWPTTIASSLAAQVVPPNPAGVSMGHIHLNAKSPELQRKFWIDVIGAQPRRLGGIDVLVIPGAVLFFNQKEPTGPTDGSVVNHVGVKVRDLPGTVEKAQAAAVQVVSRNEKQAMLLTSDGLKLELTADPTMESPVANHHIHFYTTEVEPMRKWYVDVFGAVAGKRAQFEAADLPGVNLSFTPSKVSVSPTKGRAVDHIGFEVKDLNAFAKALEAKGVKFDVPYRKLDKLGVAVAFFTDPWGTYIELTEGLTQIP